MHSSISHVSEISITTSLSGEHIIFAVLQKSWNINMLGNFCPETVAINVVI